MSGFWGVHRYCIVEVSSERRDMGKPAIKTDLPCEGCGSTDSWIFFCADGVVVLCLKCLQGVTCVLTEGEAG